ncbi:MAG: hypothetical protein EBU33_01005 [Sphingobacteriia bacterium]|nr:hypothetical protein [Sphingobacteriia bacterium]
MIPFSLSDTAKDCIGSAMPQKRRMHKIIV